MVEPRCFTMEAFRLASESSKRLPAQDDRSADEPRTAGTSGRPWMVPGLLSFANDMPQIYRLRRSKSTMSTTMLTRPTNHAGGNSAKRSPVTANPPSLRFTPGDKPSAEVAEPLDTATCVGLAI